jgi:hypothetical protein
MKVGDYSTLPLNIHSFMNVTMNKRVSQSGQITKLPYWGGKEGIF